MCGIVGLFAKSGDVEARLGADLASMLVQLSDRGPDSAGVAFYRDEVPAGSSKLTLYSPDPREDWAALTAALGEAFGGAEDPAVRATHAAIVVESEADEADAWVREHRPDLRVMSAGRAIEVYKEVGRPENVAKRFDLAAMTGTHAIGHTRMATESAVTTDGAHPYSTGKDQCLVHNGSLSNHNNLRRVLAREGFKFETENDTEVAAGYLSWKMREGLSLDDALKVSLDDLDGFYTFVVGTENGFGVLRDPIACKPAVMAETDDYVAFGTEYRALVGLPGVEQARVFEPEPARVYVWERH